MSEFASALNRLQLDVADWSRKNFGTQQPYRPLLGVIEEIGELAHAQLKKEQGIRMNEDHDAKARDAVGDIMIYLMNYCSERGFFIGECLDDAWREVSQRDWKKNPIQGIVKEKLSCLIHGETMTDEGICPYCYETDQNKKTLE